MEELALDPAAIKNILESRDQDIEKCKALVDKVPWLVEHELSPNLPFAEIGCDEHKYLLYLEHARVDELL